MLTMLLLAALSGKKLSFITEMLIKYKYSFSRLSLMIAFLLLFAMKSSSQGSYNTTNWRYSNPQQFGFSIFDVDFLDNNNVIAVGTDGGIAKSTDGGANWTYGVFSYPTPGGFLSKPAQFLDVHYVTSNVAYAVGTTGGLSTSVYPGGVMAKTTDGGTTWSMVSNPLYLNRKNINTVWFVNKDTGYIAGQWNTADSIPKLYVTKNGGATWDSLSAPIGGKTRVGYINNPNIAPFVWDITAKGKEIYKIIFTSPTTGYISGSGQSHFPPVPAVNSGTCLPTGLTTVTSANNAALIWKFDNGVLKDYSLSKERLGFSGINTNTVACNTQFNAAQISPVVQTYRALHVVNDSIILIASQNNNNVLRIYTGRNDSVTNMINGLKEPGRYEILSFTNPPTQGPNAQPPIPNPNNNIITQPYHIAKAGNGKIYMPMGSSVFNPQNRVYVSADTGRTWTEERHLPAGATFSNFTTRAIDIAPNGKFLTLGDNGVVADSTPGGTWSTTYRAVPAAASHERIEFADCNNGIAVGGSSVTVTTNGGSTWIDKARPEFAASFYNIGGHAYPNTSTLYLAVSNGTVYKSVDQGTTLDPAYSNFNYQMRDVAAIGNDSVWAVGAASFSIPAASRKPGIFRSFNGGLTWTEYSNFTAGTLAQTLSEVEFPSRNVGYAAGSRDTIWKTTDGGITWNKLPLPTPGVTPQITYADMFALDDNTVFLVGTGFPRQVVFKTTDGGNTWTNISSGILSQYNESNIFGVVFHDASNGYVVLGRGSLFKTTNGGTSWTMEYSPSSGFSALGFSPKKVPAGISFQNRILFVVAPGSATIMEYGNLANVNVNSAETIVNATCDNLSAGSIIINASGGLAPYTYSINGGPYQASNTFTGLTQGVKTISVKDAFCGIMTKSVTVGFNDNLVLTTSNDTLVCAGAPVPMLAAINGTGGSFAWSPSGGLSATNISNPTATVNSSTSYTVTATLNGCVRTKAVNIGIKPNPVIDAGPDKTILEGDVTSLSGSNISGGTPQSIAWTPVTTIVSGANALFTVVKPASTTTYTLTVRDANNCTSTDNAVITVIPNCAKVMDAFSPNGDGVNDRWLVSTGAVCFTQLSVAVFNRYGGQVYKNDNYQNNWEGTYNGKPVADGTYYYAVTFKLINGRSVTLRGDVTILR